MPIDFNKVGDFDLDAFGTDVTLQTSGAVTLTPHNMVPDQYLRTLAPDGSPPGWSKRSGPVTGGYHAYVFSTSGAVRTGGKQTFTPDGAETDTRVFNKPIVSGGLAPTRDTPGVIIPATPLEAPEVTVVASGINGFPQGEYLAAISFVDAGGRHSLLTTPVQFTISSDNKLIEWKLLLDADKTTVKGQGLWLSIPVALGGTPDPSTMRLQKVVPNVGRTHILEGPFNYTGRTTPATNETALGTPPALTMPRDFEVVGGMTHWLAPGRYVFYQTQINALGESAVSPPSAVVEFKTWTQQGIRFHPQLLPTALGFRIYWRDYYEGTLPPMYQLVGTRTGDSSAYFTAGETPTFFGNVDSGEATTVEPGPSYGTWRTFTANALTDRITVSGFQQGQEVRFKGNNLPSPLREGRSYWLRYTQGTTHQVAYTKGGDKINLGAGGGQIATYEYIKPPPNYGYIGVSGDPNTTDASGVPDPTGEIDPPVAIGLGIPPAGTYLVGYTRVLGNRETPVSEYTRVVLSEADVSAGKVMKMQYPPRANKIPNALYGQIDQKGLPISWQIKNSSDATVTVADSLHNYAQASKFYVQTSGSLANAGRYPYAITNPGEEIAVDKDRIETIAEWLELTNYANGSGYIELIQLNGSKAEVGSRFTLATMPQAGSIYFEKTVGKSGLGADFTYHDDTQYVKIQWGATGNPRQSRVYAHSLIWAPQQGISRRYEPKGSTADFDIASVDPATPYPNTHLLAIGQPPPTAATAAVAASQTVSPVLDTPNFDTLADGAEPPGWTEIVSGGASAPGAYTSTIWGNTKTYRAASSNTGSLSASYMQRNFSSVWPGGEELHGLFRIYLESLTLSGAAAAICELADNSGVEMVKAWMYRFGSSGYDLYIENCVNGQWSFITTLSLGAKVELELFVQNGNSASGIIGCTYGVGGATRVSGPGWSGVNFTSRQPRVVKMGGLGETSSSTTWAFQFGRPEITTGGATVVPNTAPALTPLVQPDWPWVDGTILNGPVSSPVDYTAAGSTRSNLAVTATLNRSGALGAERTLQQIRTSGGTELVGLYMKTDHTVELRKGATIFPASAAVPTSTDYRFSTIVEGAGTTNGTALVYRKIGTGTRELIVMARNLDFTGLYAQRATVANNTELTETNIVVSEHGEYEYDNTGPDGAVINQGYVSILPADVTNEDVGYIVDEFIVKPTEERTFAVFMRPEDLPAGAAPFTIVAYDALGRSVELGSAYVDGTAVANTSPGWAEYWLAYTPPDGYSRIRIEHRGMTGGRYVFQKPLDAPGYLDTTTLRNAARDDLYALTGTYTISLNARIPGQAQTMTSGGWGEERVALTANADAPTSQDAPFTFAANAGTDVLTLTSTSGATHRWQTNSTVQVASSGDPEDLPDPLLSGTVYYVRDVTATTIKLSATRGGSAINLTDAGTGTHSIWGTTVVTARWNSSDDENVSGVWQADPADVADMEWVEAEVTLEGDGILTPTVPTGSPYVEYITRNMPVLLKEDRTPYYGGVYLGGGGYENNLFAPFSRSLYDTETIGDRAAPRSITDVVGRLHSFTLNVFTPEALAEIYSDDFLDTPKVIESPHHDALLKVQFYEPPEEPVAMVEYEGFDERSPFAVSTMMPMVVSIERAEVLEVAPLSGEAPGTTD